MITSEHVQGLSGDSCTMHEGVAWTNADGEYGEEPTCCSPPHNWRALVLDVLKHLRALKCADAFNAPVPDTVYSLFLNVKYRDIITDPMDFATLQHKVKHDRSCTYADAVCDFQKVFRNCRAFNLPGSSLLDDADNCEAAWIALFRERGLPVLQPGTPVPDAGDVHVRRAPPSLHSSGAATGSSAASASAHYNAQSAAPPEHRDARTQNTGASRRGVVRLRVKLNGAQHSAAHTQGASPPASRACAEDPLSAVPSRNCCEQAGGDAQDCRQSGHNRVVLYEQEGGGPRGACEGDPSVRPRPGPEASGGVRLRVKIRNHTHDANCAVAVPGAQGGALHATNAGKERDAFAAPACRSVRSAGDARDHADHSARCCGSRGVRDSSCSPLWKQARFDDCLADDEHDFARHCSLGGFEPGNDDFGAFERRQHMHDRTGTALSLAWGGAGAAHEELACGSGHIAEHEDSLIARSAVATEGVQRRQAVAAPAAVAEKAPHSLHASTPLSLCAR